MTTPILTKVGDSFVLYVVKKLQSGLEVKLEMWIQHQQTNPKITFAVRPMTVEAKATYYRFTEPDEREKKLRFGHTMKGLYTDTEYVNIFEEMLKHYHLLKEVANLEPSKYWEGRSETPTT